MSHLFYISTLITIFSALGLVITTAVNHGSRSASVRLLQVARGGVAPGRTRKESFSSFGSRFLKGVRSIRLRTGMNENTTLQELFARAGLKSTAARDTYFAARMLGPVCGAVLALLFPSHRFFWMTVFGGILYLAPDIVLKRMVKRRTEKIRRAIPDAIDLLVICVDAGLGMDQAMLRVGQELGTSHPQIYEEFMQINLEQRAGKTRLDAWQSMADRSGLVEIDGFVNMLMQTERFGTPIARALSTYGDGIRLKRRQRAEELAAKTTVKIIFPLVLFIFPSMFIVLLGPAGITIARGLSSTTQ